MTPFHHLSGDSHINSSLREGPLRHLVSLDKLTLKSDFWLQAEDELAESFPGMRRGRAMLDQFVHAGKFSWFSFPRIPRLSAIMTKSASDLVRIFRMTLPR